MNFFTILLIFCQVDTPTESRRRAFEPVAEVENRQAWSIEYRLTSNPEGESKNYYPWKWCKVRHVVDGNRVFIEGITPEMQISPSSELWRRVLIHNNSTTTNTTEITFGDNKTFSRSADIYGGPLPPRYSRFLYYELAIGLGRHDFPEQSADTGPPLDIYSRINFGLLNANWLDDLAQKAPIDGIDCLEIRASDNQRVWVTTAPPFRVLKRVVCYPDSPVSYMEYKYSDFRVCEGVELPFHIEVVEYCNPTLEPLLEGTVSCRSDIQVTEISFSAPAEEIFSLTLPANTSVVDRRNGRRLQIFESDVFPPDIAAVKATKEVPPAQASNSSLIVEVGLAPIAAFLIGLTSCASLFFVYTRIARPNTSGL